MFEDWLAFKAVLVACLGWGFGVATGIILAILIAIKEDIREWIEDKWPGKD